MIHELKTPLAAAKAQAQLALHQVGEQRTDAGTARALRLISQQIDRLNRLVGDLLEASRLEAGTLEIEPTEFDLSALLEDMRSRMQPLGERHPIRVTAPERLSIFADKGRMEQVLSNLLSNVIRYSPEGGAIEINAHENRDSIQLSISDRGLGIPREHQPLIFERFGRAHGTVFGGLGLGLAISKGIIERHGGKIWFVSTGKPGEGSVFHIQLPKRPPATSA